MCVCVCVCVCVCGVWVCVVCGCVCVFSRHSSREHTALTKFRHLTRLLASIFNYVLKVITVVSVRLSFVRVSVICCFKECG